MKVYVIYYNDSGPEINPIIAHLDYDEHIKYLRDLEDKRSQWLNIYDTISKISYSKEELLPISYGSSLEENISRLKNNYDVNNKNEIRRKESLELRKKYVLESSCREDVKQDIINIIDKDLNGLGYMYPYYTASQFYVSIFELNHKYSGLE